MLAHLQYVGLSLLLIYFNRFHVSLPNNFYSDTLPSQHMCTPSYLSEFSLSKWMFQPVKVLDALLMSSVFNKQRPLDLFILTSKVKSKSLLRRQDYFKWPKTLILVLGWLLLLLVCLFCLFYKCPHQCVKKNTMLFLAVFKEHQVMPLNNKPKRFQLIHICFKQAVPLSMCLLGIRILREKTVIVKDLSFVRDSTFFSFYRVCKPRDVLPIYF